MGAMKSLLTFALAVGAGLFGAESQSGTWSGHEVIDLGGGKVQFRPLLVHLRVDANKVEGTAGQDEATQRPVTASEPPGEWLTFAVGHDTRLDLLIKGDQATGFIATEGKLGRRKVELKRKTSR